jgi:hypothetical protein
MPSKRLVSKCPTTYPIENEEEIMQKLLLSAAGAVLASSMMITPAQAFWGSWGDGPWYGGYPHYGGWGGYPGYGGYGWGQPWGYGYAPYAAPQVTTPSSSGAEK